MTPPVSLQSVGEVEALSAAEAIAGLELQFFDLHTHSNFSDGLPSIDRIEDRCLRDRLSISLTDHNEIRGSILLCERDRISCIPGVEVGTREGLEFLVYFGCPGQLEDYYRRAVEPHLLSRFMVRSRVASIECLEIARDMGGYISLAHPFAFGRKSLEFQKASRKTTHTFVDEVLERVDAIELYNGGVPPKVNRQAASFVASIDKPITVGSDSHRLRTYGSCGVYLNGQRSTDAAMLFSTLSQSPVHDSEKRAGSVSLTLPIIMLNHTLFFMRSNKHPRWRPK
ncbi:MAG: PHP domain-containing protein [Planctomycetota bacterium]|nr:PHP domain-containing protein [Planctomycetota bacterium]